MSVAIQPQKANPSVIPISAGQHLGSMNGDAAISNSVFACRTLNAHWLPGELTGVEWQEFTMLICSRRRLHAGDALFRAGDPFSRLYFVDTGSFKTVLLLKDGREQITGFHLANDVLGVEAISSLTHPNAAVALEDASVYAISFAKFTSLAHRIKYLHTWLQRLLAYEIIRGQEMLLLLAHMNANERLEVFLRDMSNRFAACGYDAHTFTLPMAREDIGNYLGLSHETVSRCFTHLKTTGVAEVDKRHIRIRGIEVHQQGYG